VLESLLALVVIVVILAVVGWALLGRREPTGARAKGYRHRSPWRRRLPALLAVLAMVFLGLAFTQFRFLRDESSAGVVVLTMDVSESMGRSDVEPSRLEAAVSAARVFLEELPTELEVGLVTFATEARTVVEPTADRVRVEGALGALARGRGTVIGDGLAAALDAIEARREGSGGGGLEAVVLLSDGRDTGGETTPLQAAARAGELEVTVHTVALGRPPSAEADAPAANTELLAEVAETTGGSAFTADTAGGLIEVYQAVQTEISTEVRISDYGALFVGIAALFAISATLTLLFGLRSDY
jgi:Ca-activated chloride channel family protein